MRKPLLPALAALALGSAATLGLAQIRELTLPEMVDVADESVYGQIVNARVFEIDHPKDGPELFFTTLTIEGKDLDAGTPVTVDVTFHGGFVSEERGVYNSEAPSADDVKLGNRVVVFYEWQDDMGGGVAANSLVAAHGGLFRTVDAPTGATVLGRGQGYAIDRNIKLLDVERAIGDLRRAKKSKQGR